MVTPMSVIQHCTASLFRLHLSFLFQFNLRRVLVGGRRKKPETMARILLEAYISGQGHAQL